MQPGPHAHTTQETTVDVDRSIDQTLLNASVRKLGAELLLTAQRSLQSLTNGRLPHVADLDHHWMTISFLESENKSAPTQVKNLLAELTAASRSWKEALTLESDVNAAMEVSNRYLTGSWNLFTSLSQTTSLADISEATSLNLSLVEFDTEVSGRPPLAEASFRDSAHLIPSPSVLMDVVALEDTLTIDSDNQQPQSGFAFAEPQEALHEHLARRQAHLFAAYQHSELIGFYLPVFGPEAITEYLPAETLAELRQKEMIHPDDRTGWVEIVGTRASNRLSLARSGVYLYDLFDSTVQDCARQEGASVLLGVVRAGEQANRSIKAHERVGWAQTGVEITGADGTTPYYVLSKRLTSTEEARKFSHPEIAHASRFELNQHTLSLKYESVEHAADITCGEALSTCSQYFNYWYNPPEVVSWPGYHEFSIQLKVGYGPAHYFLRQARPYTDLWYYDSPEDGSHAGTLEELLPIAAHDMGYSKPREYGYR